MVLTPGKLSDFRKILPAADEPVLLFRDNEHLIYWLGSAECSVFRSNTYLIIDADQGVLIDPGGKNIFREIWKSFSSNHERH